MSELLHTTKGLIFAAIFIPLISGIIAYFCFWRNEKDNDA